MLVHGLVHASTSLKAPGFYLLMLTRYEVWPTDKEIKKMFNDLTTRCHLYLYMLCPCFGVRSCPGSCSARLSCDMRLLTSSQTCGIPFVAGEQNALLGWHVFYQRWMVQLWVILRENMGKQQNIHCSAWPHRPSKHRDLAGVVGGIPWMRFGLRRWCTSHFLSHQEQVPPVHQGCVNRVTWWLLEWSTPRPGCCFQNRDFNNPLEVFQLITAHRWFASPSSSC